MDVPTNTAADRLYRIISEVYATQNESMANVWAKVLHLPSSNRLDVFRGVLSVAELVNEVESVVRRNGGHASPLYLRALDQVRNILASGVDIHRGHLNNILKPEVVNDLEHCQAMYLEADLEVVVPKERMESIKKRLEELFSEVAKANFPEELRNKILDLLEVIRQQISQFEIRGVTALHECLRQSLARLMEIYPAVQNQQDKPFFKKLFSLITDINSACDLANKGFLAWKVATKLLPFFTPDTSHAIPDLVEVEMISDQKG
jgi:hypothetical protein